MPPHPEVSDSSPDGFSPNQSRSCSPFASRATNASWPTGRSCRSEDFRMTTRALLSAVIPGPLDDRVRDRLIAETRGNPLALVELLRGRSTGELAGGFGLPGAGTPPSQIEDHFRQRIAALPG